MPVRVWLANVLWFLSCLPSWLIFAVACRRPRQAQHAVLRRILTLCRGSAFGARHALSGVGEAALHRLPILEYEDYRADMACIRHGERLVLTTEPVPLLQPTSGTTAANKWIPHTAELRREFRAAVAPWIAQLYPAEPGLFAGRQYWCISPNTAVRGMPEGVVPVGFADDTEYLGLVGRAAASALMAVPAAVARVRDAETFRYLTLLFLLRERNLRLVSVWHPSFLTVLLEALPPLRAALVEDLRAGRLGASLDLTPELRRELAPHLTPDPIRAAELAAMDLTTRDWPGRVWPALRVISCWTDGNAARWVPPLREQFPGVRIQGKGLAATEGIVSFPLGLSGRNVLAVRSHYLEFEDVGTGAVCGVDRLRQAGRYSVILTTGGGLYRYRLHDVVEVTGFCHRVPCVRFVARDNVISDQVGEKLSLGQVEAGLCRAEAAAGVAFAFALVSPETMAGALRYVLFAQGRAPLATDGWRQVEQALEVEFRSNYHYDHAREMRQLEPVRVVVVSGNATAACRQRLAARGVKEGDMKVPVLDPGGGWLGVFEAA